MILIYFCPEWWKSFFATIAYDYPSLKFLYKLTQLLELTDIREMLKVNYN